MASNTVLIEMQHASILAKSHSRPPSYLGSSDPGKVGHVQYIGYKGCAGSKVFYADAGHRNALQAGTIIAG